MRWALGLSAGLAVLALCAGALAQTGPTPPGGFGKRGNTSPLIGPRDQTNPKTTDPQAYDAISLFSRLCVSTRGDKVRTAGIVGNGDPAIEKMDPPLLRGLENGQSGGVGWIITMPLGDKILLEFPATGECLVRAPRTNQPEMENAFRNMLDEFASSGRFQVKRESEQSKTVDTDPPPPPKVPKGADPPPKKPDKVKFNVLIYSMTLPDEDRKARLILASTQSTDVSIQATLSYALVSEEKR